MCGSEPPSLHFASRRLVPERPGRHDDAARGVAAPLLAEPRARALGRHDVAFAAVLRADGTYVHHLALRHDLGAALLREPQVVLEQRVLGALAAPDHAGTAERAAGAFGSFAAEIRVRHRGAGLAEVDAHRRALERVFDPELAADVTQQLLAVAVPRYLDHAEHALGGVVMRLERRGPVVQPAPLRVGEELRARAVERVGVDGAAAADRRAAGDEHVLERGQLEDPAQPEERRPQPASQLPGGCGVLLVPEAPALLQHADLVALLREPQRRDAAAEAGADHQPVVVELAAGGIHGTEHRPRRTVTGSTCGGWELQAGPSRAPGVLQGREAVVTACCPRSPLP